jgi:prefoldin subunit 5
MKTQFNKKQITLITAATAFMILSGTVYYFNRSLKKDLNQEKIRSEALFSEKLNLEKSLEGLKNDLTVLKGRNAELDRIVEETSTQLARKESEIIQLRADNASLTDVRRKNEELQALRRKLEEDIRNLNLNMEQLIAENSRISKQMETVTDEKEFLAVQNALLEAMLADNYRVEALRGKKDKLTVAARWTNRLMVSFDVPVEIGEELNFRIVTPDGMELSSRDNESASINFYNQNNNLLASLESTSSMSQDTKRAELIYRPDHKLARGIYRFNVYNGTEYMGSMQLRLK